MNPAAPRFFFRLPPKNISLVSNKMTEVATNIYSQYSSDEEDSEEEGERLMSDMYGEATEVKERKKKGEKAAEEEGASF